MGVHGAGRRKKVGGWDPCPNCGDYSLKIPAWSKKSHGELVLKCVKCEKIIDEIENPFAEEVEI